MGEHVSVPQGCTHLGVVSLKHMAGLPIAGVSRIHNPSSCVSQIMQTTLIYSGFRSTGNQADFIGSEKYTKLNDFRAKVCILFYLIPSSALQSMKHEKNWKRWHLTFLLIS